MNKYVKKVEELYKDYTKKYKRKDQSFAMMTIKSQLEEIEKGGYSSYTDEELEIISKFLCERYFECMSIWKDKVEERMKQTIFYY